MWDAEKIRKERAKAKEKKRKAKERFLAMVQRGRLKKEMQRSSSVSSEEDEEFFVWEKYLAKCQAKAVPREAFKHVSDDKKPGFESGMKVEAKDQSSSDNTYWVATIVMVSGPLLLLRFDGCDEDPSRDFWLDSASDLLQPIGWSDKTNNILIPPEFIRHKNSNWAKFLVEDLCNAVAAPDHLFHNLESFNTLSYGDLKVGVNLDIQDEECPLCYWPAVIVEMFGLRLRLRFIGYEEEDQDFWEHYYSLRVHNLGWGKAMGLMIQPPKVISEYPQWKVYRSCVDMCLQRNFSPKHNFEIEEIHKHVDIKTGMKLEAMHPEKPAFIAVGTIKQILNDYFFTVEIDSVHTAVKSISKPSTQYVCHAKSKYIYPVGWCEKQNLQMSSPKGFFPQNHFTWEKYLESCKAELAPKSLFSEKLVKPSEPGIFKAGDIVEVLNLDQPPSYWVATVISAATFYQLRMPGSMGDLYIYCCTDIVKPLGFGQKNGFKLKPRKEWVDWRDEISLLSTIFAAENAVDLSKVMTKLGQKDELPAEHKFETGMQLEAVNPQDPSSICVASVVERINAHYFMVQIDEYIEMNIDHKPKFWCHSGSRNIFPVGWCEKNNIQLTPPPGNPYKEFSWSMYMQLKKSKQAPEALFPEPVTSCLFEPGNKLEVVDQTSPQTISVGTVTQAVNGTVWIKLDGYQSNAVEQIYDVQSCCLFPVGWCSMHGHPLLAPVVKKREADARNWSGLLRKRSTPNTNQADSSTTKRRKVDKLVNTSSKSTSKTLKVNTRSPDVPSTIGIVTPSSSTEDSNGTRQEECTTSTTTTIDLTDDYPQQGDKELLLFVKKSCSCGPYLYKNKISSLPDKIGPAAPNIVLKRVVEHVVLCSISGAKIIGILSAETAKQSFLSILKTLTTKLEICENLFSLNKIDACSHCDKEVISSSSPLTPTLATVAKPSSTTNGIPTKLPLGRPPPNVASSSKTPSITSTSLPRTPSVFKSPGLTHRTFVQPGTNGNGDDVVSTLPPGHISTWTADQVVQFVSSRGCKKFCSVFQEQEVDGKALMLLSLDDIHKVLGVTLGPAIKLQDDVQKLRYKKS